MHDKGQLMDKRINILLQMNALRRVENFAEGVDSIKELQQEYNDIMDNLDHSNTTVRYDPIDKFPPELFGAIIYEAIRLDFPDQSYKQLNDALVLTLVSRRWRDFILGMPLLWTNIDVNSQQQDYLAKSSLCLELSQDLPITLNLTLPVEHWDVILPLLQLNRYRVSGITIFLLSMSNNLEPVLTGLEQLFPMPNLMHLESRLGDHDSVLRLFLAQKCSLKSIKWFSLPEDTWKLQSVRQLQDVRIAADLDKFVSTQYDMPLLRYVMLGNRLSQPHEKTLPFLTKASSTDSEPLRWQGLECFYPSAQSISILTTRLKSLISLRITMSIPLLKQLLVHLHQLLQLQRLAMYFDDFQTPLANELFDLELLPNSKVTILEIGTVSMAKKNEDEQTSRVLATIPDALTRAMPEIEELMLRLGADLDFPEFYDWNKLACLSKLSLTSFRRSRLDRRYILPSTLKSVQLDIRPSTWDQFSCSSATKLSVYTTKKYLPHMATVPPGAEKWPALRTLDTPWPCITVKGQNYAHLNELTLSLGPTTYYNSWTETNYGAQFCYELANDPTQLATLESLRLYGLPQWDIFLIMLKRRNITTLPGVRPFRSLTIRAFYPEELNGPISSLLRGRFSDWPPLYEISINTAFELILNTSMYVHFMISSV
jgi:hypothetical protein